MAQYLPPEAGADASISQAVRIRPGIDARFLKTNQRSNFIRQLCKAGRRQGKYPGFFAVKS